MPAAAPPNSKLPRDDRIRISERRWLWVAPLALALILLAGDSVRRLRVLDDVTNRPVGARLQPEPDPDSPSGYRWNQHRLVLTQIDGYEWLLEAEQELSGGGARVRDVSFDNAPVGREVHWAGFMRWWGLGVARAYRTLHPELSAPQALEQVASWANAALLVVLLLALTPLLAARFGWMASGLFAVACVAVHPFYDLFAVGYFDHHGVAGMTCLVTVVFLVAGGGAWVRADETENGKTGQRDRAVTEWLPTLPRARRWFVASGLMGGVGLWISAAAMAPVLAGIGVGALVSFLSARSTSGRARWSFQPELFRVWGAAGASASLCFYLIEYFPGHMGMRLEVNHPLYALAFLGGGDLLARLAPMLAGQSEPTTAPPGDGRFGSPVGWLLADVASVLALPAVALVNGEASFRLGDRFLWLLHTRSIIEFLPLIRWMQLQTPAQVVGQMSQVPLVAFVVAALIWPTRLTGRWRAAWRALSLISVGTALVYAYVFALSLTGGSPVLGVAGAAVMGAVWFLLPLSYRAEPLAPPVQAVLVIAVLPALLMLQVSLLQMRWLGIAAALWIGVLVVSATVMLRTDHLITLTTGARLAIGTLALATLVLAPAVSVSQPFTRPNGDAITRDASLWLRRRVGDDAGVILAAPTATTHMIWFGGFRGIGTLYWENLEGLRATTAIHGAPDPDSARALLARYGVTHVVFYGWDPGLDQLEYSAAVASGTEAGGPVGYLSRMELEMRAGNPVSFPPWLVPLPYAPATVEGYRHPIVQILEVVPDQPPEIALARLARFYKAVENTAGMEQALARSLEIGPSVAGLAMTAQILHLSDDAAGFTGTIERLRTELAREGAIDVEDRLDAAVALGLGGDAQAVTRQLDIALAQADERQLRRLPPDRLQLIIDLSRQLGLDRTHPDVVALVQGLIPRGAPLR